MKDKHENILEVHNLKTCFEVDRQLIPAVDCVTFRVKRGTTLALVGESGCGKTVTAMSILKLVQKPGRIMAGSVRLYPRDESPIDITALSEKSDMLYRIRGGLVGMIFQEPGSALSPVHTIGNQICEGLFLHTSMDKKQAAHAAIDMLHKVGIANPEDTFKRYPHEISGGMRQRAVIAMALVCGPSMLIADEPTTALDVTIQAQILALIKQLQSQMGISVLLITHDLGVVAQIADEVAVMYLGRIVERASTRDLINEPRHPYTKALLKSLPGMSQSRHRLLAIEGSVPPLNAIPAGCPFHPRCSFARAGRCDVGTAPVLRQMDDHREVACLRAEEIASE